MFLLYLISRLDNEKLTLYESQLLSKLSSDAQNLYELIKLLKSKSPVAADSSVSHTEEDKENAKEVSQPPAPKFQSVWDKGFDLSSDFDLDTTTFNKGKFYTLFAFYFMLS